MGWPNAWPSIAEAHYSQARGRTGQTACLPSCLPAKLLAACPLAAHGRRWLVACSSAPRASPPAPSLDAGPCMPSCSGN